MAAYDPERFKRYRNSLAWRAKERDYQASGRSCQCVVCKQPWNSYHTLMHMTFMFLYRERLDDLGYLCRPCFIWHKKVMHDTGRTSPQAISWIKSMYRSEHDRPKAEPVMDKPLKETDEQYITAVLGEAHEKLVSRFTAEWRYGEQDAKQFARSLVVNMHEAPLTLAMTRLLNLLPPDQAYRAKICNYVTSVANEWFEEAWPKFFIQTLKAPQQKPEPQLRPVRMDPREEPLLGKENGLPAKALVLFKAYPRSTITSMALQRHDAGFTKHNVGSAVNRLIDLGLVQRLGRGQWGYINPAE